MSDLLPSANNSWILQRTSVGPNCSSKESQEMHEVRKICVSTMTVEMLHFGRQNNAFLRNIHTHLVIHRIVNISGTQVTSEGMIKYYW